jgi:hypothetical protein
MLVPTVRTAGFCHSRYFGSGDDAAIYQFEIFPMYLERQQQIKQAWSRAEPKCRVLCENSRDAPWARPVNYFGPGASK